jgi:hypothetical protein
MAPLAPRVVKFSVLPHPQPLLLKEKDDKGSGWYYYMPQLWLIISKS